MLRDFKELPYKGKGKFAFLDNLFCNAMEQCCNKNKKKMCDELSENFDNYMRGINIKDFSVDSKWFEAHTYRKYKGNQVPMTDRDYKQTIHLRIFAYYMGQLCMDEKFEKLLEESLEKWEIYVPEKGTYNKLHYMLECTFNTLYKKYYMTHTGMPKYVVGSKLLAEGAEVKPKSALMTFAQLKDTLKEGDLLSNCFSSIRNSSSNEVKIAYCPIYSLSNQFLINKENIHCNIDNDKYWLIEEQIKEMLEGSIDDKENWIKLQIVKELKDASDRGYPMQPDILWARSMSFDNQFTFHLDCGHTGEGGYLYHKIWQKKFFELCSNDFSKVADNSYMRLIDNPADKLTASSIKTTGAYHTTRIGGGIWIITSDGYIACSNRGKNLRDESGKISYSSSGSFENTGWDSENGESNPDAEYGPFAQMSKVVKEELGLDIKTNQIWMSEVGIDLYGGWIQFSFFITVPYKATEISMKRNQAVDKKEFTLFFIPYAEAKYMLLDMHTPLGTSYDIESSARYSLFNIINRYPDPKEIPVIRAI